MFIGLFISSGDNFSGNKSKQAGKGIVVIRLYRQLDGK